MDAELTDTEVDKEPVPIKVAGISDVLGRANKIHELIARRAYAIYEGRGDIYGHDIEDWLQAKSEVVCPLCAGFMELNGDLRVDFGIRKCELPELRMSIEPWRLIVSGKRNVHNERVAQGHLGERSGPVEIFEVVNFPVQVEPSGAKATLANGLLQLRVPKVRKIERSLAAKAG